MLFNPNYKSQLTFHKATWDCQEYSHICILLYQCSYTSLSICVWKVWCGFEMLRLIGNQMTINFLIVSCCPWCKVCQHALFHPSNCLTTKIQIVNLQFNFFIDVYDCQYLIFILNLCYFISFKICYKKYKSNVSQWLSHHCQLQ